MSNLIGSATSGLDVRPAMLRPETSPGDDPGTSPGDEPGNLAWGRTKAQLRCQVAASSASAVRIRPNMHTPPTTLELN